MPSPLGSRSSAASPRRTTRPPSSPLGDRRARGQRARDAGHARTPPRASVVTAHARPVPVCTPGRCAPHVPRACDALAEIGLDPGPDLRHLERAISVHDDSLGIDPMPSTTAMVAPKTAAPAVDDGELGRTARSNLPSPADSFVGRQRELIQLADALTAHRLVTIVGVGGMGKSAWLSKPPPEPRPFDDGSWLVDLGAVHVDTEVDRAVAAAIGVRSAPGAAMWDSIAEWCSRSRRADHPGQLRARPGRGRPSRGHRPAAPAGGDVPGDEPGAPPHRRRTPAPARSASRRGRRRGEL